MSPEDKSAVDTPVKELPKKTKKQLADEAAALATAAEKKKVNQIAMMCHGVNKMWRTMNGDNSEPGWGQLPDNTKEVIINMVKYRLDKPKSTPEDIYKIPGKPETPYSKLPEFSQKKYSLFCAIVDALK